MLDRLRPIFSIQAALLLALVALSGVAAEAFAPSGVEVNLWLVAIAAGVLGIVLGLLRVPDSVSHLTAILSGAAIAVIDVATRLTPDDPAASWLDRFRVVAYTLRDWYLGVGDVRETEIILIGVLLQVVTWLLAYLSGWALMRHSWISVTLLIPWTVIGGTEVLLEDSHRALLGAAVVVGLVLLARTTYLRRRGEQERGVGRGFGSLLAASTVAAIVLAAGLFTPENFTANNVQPATEYAMETWLEAQDSAGDWLAETFDISGSRVPDIDDYPRYTAFDDAFSVGGSLELSDQPEVLVQTNSNAPYLAAQSYDSYTGRGWESTVADDFNAEGPDGVRYSPELTFNAGQSVPYTNLMRGERKQTQMVVTPLGSSSEHIFSTGMFYSSDERASVRMAWRQLENEVYPLRSMDLSTLPPDLTGIVALLIRAESLTVEGDGGLMYPSVVAERERLMTVRKELARRFVEISWTVGADGRVDTLVVTGQLPIYDDNVAVTRADGEANSPYTVTSLDTQVTVDTLRAAGTAYPAWVTDSYLELPDTVTNRTIDLSYQIAGGSGSAYDQAKAVEQFLRSHITYDLQVGVPGSDWDIVDYVLFEDQRGYCEHYASAMTVMLRALGIPARTVVGYFPGELDLEAGGYVYRQQNAHAWTEAFFPGYGWIQFEPTSARPESSLDQDADAPPPPQLQPTPTPVPPEPTVAPPEVGTPVPEQEQEPIPDVVPDDPSDSSGGDRFSWPVISAAAIAGAAVLGTIGWIVLNRRASADSRSLFSSLVRWGRFGGVRDDVSSTPREYAHAVGTRYPDRAQDANEIVDIYEAQEYGGTDPDRWRLERASQAVREFKRAVMRQIVRLGR